MKFGVDAPWYNDPVERTAFNLYAMNCDKLEAIARQIASTFSPDEIDGLDVEDISYSFDLSDEDAEYVYDMLQELM